MYGVEQRLDRDLKVWLLLKESNSELKSKEKKSYLEKQPNWQKMQGQPEYELLSNDLLGSLNSDHPLHALYWPATQIQ